MLIASSAILLLNSKYIVVVGRGVFTAMPLKEGDFIAQYAGEVISSRDGNAREKSNPSCFRYFFVHQGKRLW